MIFVYKYKILQEMVMHHSKSATITNVFTIMHEILSTPL